MDLDNHTFSESSAAASVGHLGEKVKKTIKQVKSRGQMLRFRNTCQDPVGVKKFEFCAHSAGLLNRKCKAKHCWSNQTKVF